MYRFPFFRPKMKLIVGLGNRGEEYVNTRHNVGFMVVDELAESMGVNKNFSNFKDMADVVKKGTLLLVKPTTLMNSSGNVVRHVTDFFKIDNSRMWVVHDDLDLRLGEFKIRKGKGPKDHKGLLSLYNKLGTKDFWHVRVGVDNRKADARIAGEEYVLQRFTKNELDKISVALGKVVDKIKEDVNL